MKKLKEERGSITLFVIVSMLFFILVLSGVYMLSSTGEQTEISETTRIKEIYEKDMNRIDDIYATTEASVLTEEVIQKGIYVSLKETTLGFYDNEEDAKEGISEQYYYGNIKELTFLRGDTPWYKHRDHITTVTFYNEIAPNNTAYYFSDLENLTTIQNIEKLDTRNVINMNWMFGNCSKLTSLDVSNFQTGKVMSMEAMFYNCKLLTTLDVAKFDTKNVTNMNGMFQLCEQLTTLDLRGFDINKVTTMREIFENCVNLKMITVNKEWSTTGKDTTGMFTACGTKAVTSST